jgi:hypothetical protein
MTLDELLASGRHLVTFAAGAITTFGLTKAVNPDVLVTSFDHIFNGVKEIAVGLGPIAAAGMAWWATRKSSPAAKVATVSALPSVDSNKLAAAIADPELKAVAKAADPSTAVKVTS